MAGEWIAMGADLWTAPEVIQLSAFCQHHVSACQTRMSARCTALGCLFRIWSIVDVHCSDGILTGYRPSDIDEEVGVDGFCDAMMGVGWLEESPQGLIVPQFEKWFSKSAKRRRMNADYQAASRERRQHSVSKQSDKVLTREEKRREENNTKENTKKKASPAGETFYSLDGFVLPTAIDTPEVRKSLNDWIAYKRGYKQAGITALRNKAQSLGTPERIIAAVEHSLASKYAGLFEPSTQPQQKQPIEDRVGKILARTQNNANAS